MSANFFYGAEKHLNNFNRSLHSHQFNAFGRPFNTVNGVRGGLAFGLGAIALRNAQDSYHKMKYGEIGGSMLSAAMGTAAAAGAYQMAIQKGTMHNLLNSTAARFGRMASRMKV